jgi:hypothetical protein
LQGSNILSTSTSTSTSKNGNGNGNRNYTDHLLRERNGITNNIRNINTIIEEASDVKNNLFNQRFNTMNNTLTNLLNISKKIPILGNLIDSLNKKKSKDNIIIAIFISILLIFTIWWVLLR